MRPAILGKMLPKLPKIWMSSVKIAIKKLKSLHKVLININLVAKMSIKSLKIHFK